MVENYLEVPSTHGTARRTRDGVIRIARGGRVWTELLEVEKGLGNCAPIRWSRASMSLAELLHDAAHPPRRRIPDAGLTLAELIRYLEHPRAGATGFDDMGSNWALVREVVAAGTLRAGDSKVPPVANSWIRLVRPLCLRLTT